MIENELYSEAPNILTKRLFTFFLVKGVLPALLTHVLQHQGLLAHFVVHVDQGAAGDRSDLKVISAGDVDNPWTLALLT